MVCEHGNQAAGLPFLCAIRSFRDSRRSPPPQQPQLLLKCEFNPALTGGFLRAPLSFNQARRPDRLGLDPKLPGAHWLSRVRWGSGWPGGPLGEWRSSPSVRGTPDWNQGHWPPSASGGGGHRRPGESKGAWCPMLRVPEPPVPGPWRALL